MKVMSTREGDDTCFAATLSTTQMVVTASTSGKLIVFDTESIRELSKTAQGVRGMKLTPGASSVFVVADIPVSSASFLAATSVSSPQKIFIFIIQTNLFRIKVSNKKI